MRSALQFYDRLTAGLVVVENGSPVQLLLGIFIAALYIVAFMNCKPMEDDADDRLQVVCSLQITLTMALGLAIGWTNSRKLSNVSNSAKGATEDFAMGILLILMNVVVFGLGIWTTAMCADKAKKWATLVKIKLLGLVGKGGAAVATEPEAAAAAAKAKPGEEARTFTTKERIEHVRSLIRSGCDLSNVTKLFKTVDKDGDGFIQRREFAALVSGIEARGTRNGTRATSKEDIDTCFDHIDDNSNGVLEFNEFANFLGMMLKVDPKQPFAGPARLIGQKVALFGLKKKAELNGCLGVIQSYDADVKRYRVLIEKDPTNSYQPKSYMLKRDNFEAHARGPKKKRRSSKKKKKKQKQEEKKMKRRGTRVITSAGDKVDAAFEEMTSQAARTLFDAIDRDRNGVLDKEELLLAVEDPDTIGMIRSQKFLAPLLNPETFEALFVKMDLNSDGEIDFEEFQAALSSELTSVVAPSSADDDDDEGGTASVTVSGDTDEGEGGPPPGWTAGNEGGDGMERRRMQRRPSIIKYGTEGVLD